MSESETKTVKVTFKVPPKKTVTHAGERVEDGQKADVTARQAERLKKRGLIA